MVKAARLMAFSLAATLIMGAGVLLYAQEKNEPKITFLTGEVVSVDSDASTVVIKQLIDVAANTYKDADIAVLPETKIIRGDAALTLSELNAGDKVEVESKIDASGKSKVTAITVEPKEAAKEAVTEAASEAVPAGNDTSDR